MTEDQLQAKCWQWTWNTYPQTRYTCWHTPNESKRTPVQAIQLKAMGMLKGVVDQHLYWNNTLYIIEFKIGNAQPTKEQRLYINAMVAQGAVYYLVYTFEAYTPIVTAVVNGNPLPGHTPPALL